MKIASVIELLIANAVLLALYVLVTQDYATRAAYSRSIGFTPLFQYGPLTYILSSASGSTRIPGLLTLDWAQILLLVLILLDGLFALEVAVRHRYTV